MENNDAFPPLSNEYAIIANAPWELLAAARYTTCATYTSCISSASLHDCNHFSTHSPCWISLHQR